MLFDSQSRATAMKVERTHDDFYLNEHRYENTKESFKSVGNHLVKALAGVTSPVVLDVGCAAGEFLFHARRILSGATLKGVDVMPALVERAREMVPGADFAVGSVLEADAAASGAADATMLLGVHSIFDDWTVPLTNLLRWTRPGGYAFLFGMFNPYPVDALIKVRRSNSNGDGAWEPGWNVVSIASLGNWLNRQSHVDRFDCYPFNIGIDLPKLEDPLRTWTERMEDGSRQTINGIGLVHPFQLIVIKNK